MEPMQAKVRKPGPPSPAQKKIYRATAEKNAAERKAVAIESAKIRLMPKAEVCAIAGVTFVTIWNWQRKGLFPRARIVGGKSLWLSTDIDAWLASLPVRPLKGDGDAHGKRAA
jgi:predicted DNA-binding transcriptional regulator AlpA